MKLYGHDLDNDERIKTLIDELVLEVQKRSAHISALRDPQAENEKESSDLIAKIGKLRGRPLQYPYVGTGLGNGPFVELEDGSIKLDLINGIGVHIQGHSHPETLRAGILGGMMDIVNNGNLQLNRDYIDFVEKIVEMAGRNSRLKYAWVSTCGSVANENALKMVRQKHSPARLIVSPFNAFAGRTTMMAEITDNAAYKQGLPTYNEVLRVPFCNRSDSNMCKGGCGRNKALEAFKAHYAQHEKNIAAFMFEPVIGEGGYRVPCREYLISMLEFCKEKGIAVWADEVQTFLRTGEAFAFETLGFGKYVDLVTVAKTAQVGVTLYTEEYNPQPGLVAGTFAGSSQALRTGLSILNMLDDGKHFGLKGKIQSIHERFVKGLQRLGETTCQGTLTDIEGLGLMIAFTPLDGSKDAVNNYLKVLYKNGIVTLGCGRDPYRVRFLVPVVITEAQIDLALQVIEKSLIECSKG